MTKQLSKCYWLSESFKEVFEGVTPSKKAPKMKFTKLTKITTDEEILKTTGIMSKEDCLAALIEITKKKEPETMDGHANIMGYVEHNGSVRYAYAVWSSGVQEWCCYSGGLSRWGADHRFWSREKVSDRILKNTEITKDCWIFKGAKTEDYGKVKVAGKTQIAHRVIYENLVGKIPKGMVIDHLCRNRSCLNPKHLEPVTSKINTMRGNGLAAINSRKTKCINGHEFSGENLRVVEGKRYCKKCQSDYQKNRNK